jgi:hypothetical protein
VIPKKEVPLDFDRVGGQHEQSPRSLFRVVSYLSLREAGTNPIRWDFVQFASDLREPAFYSRATPLATAASANAKERRENLADQRSVDRLLRFHRPKQHESAATASGLQLQDVYQDLTPFESLSLHEKDMLPISLGVRDGTGCQHGEPCHRERERVLARFLGVTRQNVGVRLAARKSRFERERSWPLVGDANNSTEKGKNREH